MNREAQVAPSPIVPALLKLIETVEEENSTLQQQQVTSHVGYTERKNQALRELMAAQRRESSWISGEIRSLLQRLSVLLEANSHLLKLHIAAVGEVSDIIVGSLRAAESDGTYSRNPAPPCRR